MPLPRGAMASKFSAYIAFPVLWSVCPTTPLKPMPSTPCPPLVRRLLPYTALSAVAAASTCPLTPQAAPVVLPIAAEAMFEVLLVALWTVLKVLLGSRLLARDSHARGVVRGAQGDAVRRGRAQVHLTRHPR